MSRIDIEKIDLIGRNRKTTKRAAKQRIYIATTKSGKIFEFASAFRKGSEQNRLDAFLDDNNPVREAIIKINIKRKEVLK